MDASHETSLPQAAATDATGILSPDGNLSLLPGVILATEHVRAGHIELDRAGCIGLDGPGRPSLTSNADRMRLVPRVLPRDPGACGHPHPARLGGLVLIDSKSKRPDGVLVPFREIDDDLVRPGNDA